MEWLIYATALGSALVAGIFFAFSTFVMKALGRIDERSAISAMQSINITVLNPWFFLAFFGTGVLCLATVVAALRGDLGSGKVAALVGSILYLAGCLLATIVLNVPLNDRLAEVDPEDPAGKALWSLYLVRWTRWNHLRTVASAAAAVAFGIALGIG